MKYRHMFLLFFLLSFLSCRQALSPAQEDRIKAAAEALDTANSEGTETAFLQALDSWQKLGQNSATANEYYYYNLGNLYFKTGQKGLALLNYRKAHILNPWDRKVEQNLAFVRSIRKDDLEESARQQLSSAFFYWNSFIPPELVLFLFLSGFILFWLLLVPEISRIVPSLRKSVWIILIVSFLSGGSLFMTYIHQQNGRQGVIVSEEVVPRKGDSLHYEPAFQNNLHEGTEFVLEEIRSGWFRIRLSDDTSCWISEKDAELIRF